MKKETVRLLTINGWKEVKGFVVAPGLAVTPSVVRAGGSNPAGWWNVTHLPSGKAIGGPRPFWVAWRLAKGLMTLGDWTIKARRPADFKAIDPEKVRVLIRASRELDA